MFTFVGDFRFGKVLAESVLHDDKWRIGRSVFLDFDLTSGKERKFAAFYFVRTSKVSFVSTDLFGNSRRMSESNFVEAVLRGDKLRACIFRGGSVEDSIFCGLFRRNLLTSFFPRFAKSTDLSQFR